MRSFFKSFVYAFNGLKISLLQRNMKIHTLCALLVIILGFVFKISLTEWCIILICIGVVLALEIINTAIEAFVDMVQPNYHPIAGKIKDLSAAAVFIFSIVAFICGILVFGKNILDLTTFIQH